MIAAGTGLFAGATGVPQYFEQKKAAREAARAQEQANRVSQASAQVENARRRRRAIAQARMAAATNTAAMSGDVQSSSALSGVQSSLATQLGANIGAQQQQVNTQQNIMNLQQQGANAMRRGQERAGLWQAAGNIGQMIASFGTAGAGGLPTMGGQSSVNLQGQQSPLYNNSAFVSRY
jgi:multidrug efflux pump subunit AcrA (membrane-fusion protein)